MNSTTQGTMSSSYVPSSFTFKAGAVDFEYVQSPYTKHGNNWPDNTQGVVTSFPITAHGLQMEHNTATAKPIAVTDRGNYWLMGDFYGSNCSMETTRGGYAGSDVTRPGSGEATKIVLLNASTKDTSACSKGYYN